MERVLLIVIDEALLALETVVALDKTLSSELESDSSLPESEAGVGSSGIGSGCNSGAGLIITVF